MAFYDHHAAGPTPAKAYLITAEQFADVAAQEMNRPPEADSPLEDLVFDLPVGASHSVGPGGYETLLVLDDIDGVPMVTFTAPHGTVAGDAAHRQCRGQGRRGASPVRSCTSVRSSSGVLTPRTAALSARSPRMCSVSLGSPAVTSR